MNHIKKITDIFVNSKNYVIYIFVNCTYIFVNNGENMLTLHLLLACQPNPYITTNLAPEENMEETDKTESESESETEDVEETDKQRISAVRTESFEISGERLMTGAGRSADGSACGSGRGSGSGNGSCSESRVCMYVDTVLLNGSATGIR